MNKYSPKDLANIFGKKSLEESVKPEVKVEDEFNPAPIGSKDNTGGIVTIKGGNISEYFKNKMLSAMEMSVEDEEDKRESNESEDERYVGFGFNSTQSDQSGGFSQSVQDATNHAFENSFRNLNPSPMIKPPKKRKSVSAFVNEDVDLNYPDKSNTPKKIKTTIKSEITETEDCFVNPALNLDCTVDETYNGTKFEVSRTACGLINPVLDLPEETIKKKRNKKREKVLESSTTAGFVNSALNLNCIDEELQNGTTFEISRTSSGLDNRTLNLSGETKKKRSKKGEKVLEFPSTTGFINPALDLNFVDEELQNGTTFEACRASSGLVDPALDLPEETIKKKRNKKREKVLESSTTVGFVNPALDLNCIDEELQNGTAFEVSKASSGLDNRALNLSEETSGKRSKKREKIVEFPSTTGFINPALNLDCADEELHSGTVFEVSRLQMGLANDALDLSDEACGKKRVTFNDCVEYNTDAIKKKKGKTKLDKFEVENDKLKRKKENSKKKRPVPEETAMIFVNEALDVEAASEEIQDNEVNERKCRKEKRKKNRRISNLETIEEAPEEDKEEAIRDLEIITVQDAATENPEEIVEEETTKKSKKKKKKKKEGEKNQDEVIDNSKTVKIEDTSLIEGENQSPEETNDQSLKKKKKKKKDKKENHADMSIKINGLDKENLSNYQNENVAETEKKKKKKRKSIETFESFLDEDVIMIKTESELEINQELLEEPHPESKKSKKKRSRDVEIEEESNIKIEKNSEDCATPSKKRCLSGDVNFEVPLSPYETMAKKSKSVLKAMFTRSPIVNFKGSNINEIKGYGMGC